MARIEDPTKTQLMRFLARGGVGNELIDQLNEDDDRMTDIEASLPSIVLQTMDPDDGPAIDEEPGASWDTGSPTVDTFGVGQSITLTEEITFNEITLKVGLSEVDTEGQVVISVRELDETTVGALVAKSRGFVSGNDSGNALENSNMMKFQFPSTTLPAGTYIVIVEARDQNLTVLVKVGGTYEGGQIYDVQDITEPDPADYTLADWGSDPAYDMYLVMRYNP